MTVMLIIAILGGSQYLSIPYENMDKCLAARDRIEMEAKQNKIDAAAWCDHGQG